MNIFFFFNAVIVDALLEAPACSSQYYSCQQYRSCYGTNDDVCTTRTCGQTGNGNKDISVTWVSVFHFMFLFMTFILPCALILKFSLTSIFLFSVLVIFSFMLSGGGGTAVTSCGNNWFCYLIIWLGRTWQQSMFLNICIHLALWYSNLSWGFPTTAHFVCVPQKAQFKSCSLY